MTGKERGEESIILEGRERGEVNKGEAKERDLCGTDSSLEKCQLVLLKLYC